MQELGEFVVRAIAAEETKKLLHSRLELQRSGEESGPIAKLVLLYPDQLLQLEVKSAFDLVHVRVVVQGSHYPVVPGPGTSAFLDEVGELWYSEYVHLVLWCTFRVELCHIEGQTDCWFLSWASEHHLAVLQYQGLVYLQLSDCIKSWVGVHNRNR